MQPTVAIVAAGSMGAAVARRLVDHGVRVVTTLIERGAATRARACAAGMIAVAPEQLLDADFILSIVPPAVALPFAGQMATYLHGAKRQPVFVDCNAVSPATVRRIHATIAATGAAFVDAGIIGPPPQPGANATRFYASGATAARFQTLSACGLDIRMLDGPIGAASGLKMAYAGITKGGIAIVTTMVLAASRTGGAEALRRELCESEPALLALMTQRVPAMFPKAYRWVAEMQEIAQFAGDDASASAIYTAVSRLYDRLARDVAGSKEEVSVLTQFFSQRE